MKMKIKEQAETAFAKKRKRAILPKQAVVQRKTKMQRWEEPTFHSRRLCAAAPSGGARNASGGTPRGPPCSWTRIRAGGL